MPLQRTLAVALLLLATVAPAPAHGTAHDLVVTADEDWVGRSVQVPGDLVVRAPATLTLAGTQLRVGGRILVEPGATLRLGPDGTTATDLGALAAGPPTATNGFWMQVDGDLLASGTPATRIHGLRGAGVDDFFTPDGGIQVNGQAVLEDVHLSGSNSTVFARGDGWVTLTRAHVGDMGFLGAGAWGRLDVHASTFEGSVNGIMGHTCRMLVADTRIEAALNGILGNGCTMDVQRTEVYGAANALFFSGAANATVQDVRLLDYTRHGLWAEGFPGADQPKKPTLRVTGALLDPRGHQSSPQDGVTLQSARADLRDVTVRNNTGFGILSKDASVLHLEDSRVWGNGYLGLFSNGARVDGDLLASNDFGTPGTPTANAGGPLRVLMVAMGVVTDADGGLLAGARLRVHGPDGEVGQSPLGGQALMQAPFEAYASSAQGLPLWLGPFTYTLEHPDLGAPEQGALDLAEPLVSASVPAPDGGANGFALASLAFGALAVVLLVLGVFWRPLKRLVRRRGASSGTR